MKIFSTYESNLNITSIDNTEESLIQSKYKSQLDERNMLPNDTNYNTGRWSHEEHKKFLESIFKYGNEWKKIKEFIGSRSSTQARSHAQKFFIRLKKRLFAQNSGLKRKNYDQNSIANIITCFQDCLPSQKINLDESNKLIKLLMSLSNESKNKDEKCEKNNDNLKSKNKDNYFQRKKRFFIEKIDKNKEFNDSKNFEIVQISMSMSSDSQFNFKNSLNNLCLQRKDNFTRRNKLKLNKKKRQLASLNQIKELKNNLIIKNNKKFIFNEELKNYPLETIIYNQYNYLDSKKINNQNQGVFEDLQSYYQQTFKEDNMFQIYKSRNLDVISNCPIEQLNIETMFNCETCFYTYNKIDINSDTI